MPEYDTPIVNTWYKLPDSDTFRVVAADLDEGYIEIQFADGSLEGIDLETWNKLGAEKTEPSEEWLETLENELDELDFYELGGAPGSEAFDFTEYYE